VDSPEEFEGLALELFQYQARHNVVYGRYLRHLSIEPASIQHVTQIPHLPIRFFKRFPVVTGSQPTLLQFKSSGTGGMTPSTHHVADPELYQQSFTRTFERFFGPAKNYFIACLLPSYLQRQDASLVYMCKHLLAQSEDPDGGFFLEDVPRLRQLLEAKKAAQKPILLLGVSFALWQMAEEYPLALRPGDVVMETGGMKGRRREITRQELHHILQNGFAVRAIASEYGMTELLSQAYAQEGGLFQCPPWMRVYTRDLHDPFAERPLGKTGALNIIDLANLDSCAFLETEDLGRCYGDGRFEVLGRFDQADLRGCNLMLA